MKEMIQFEIKKDNNCNLIHGEHPDWGCCCICVFKKLVHKHCRHNPKVGNECICDESLGFNVCIIATDIDGVEKGRINICGEHGCCEFFIVKNEFKDKYNNLYNKTS